MGANSSQGIAVVVFLVAFVLLGWGLFLDGNFLLLLLFFVTLAASIGLLMKAKALDGVK